MRDSLRRRLLLWHAAVATLLVAAVGAAVCWVTWRARLAGVDAELLSRADTIAAAVRPGVGGAFDVELPPDATDYFQRPDLRAYFAVWSDGGRLLDRSDPDIVRAGPPPRGVRTRGALREATVVSRGVTVLIGRDITDVWGELWSLARTMGVVAAAGVAASLVLAWVFAGRALAPVQRINETARQMAAGDLGARVNAGDADSELGQVAAALNAAFDRLQDSIERQRRFTADASHELRTPVTTIAAEIEWALLRERSSGDYRESLETCGRAAGRLRSLVEGLLALARADSGAVRLRLAPVPLEAIARSAADALRPVAQRRHVTVHVADTPAVVAGDADRLGELLTNLLFNAIVYNRPGGSVSVELAQERGRVVMRVIDNGIGIEPKDMPRVFDRFFRGPAAREREPGGAGLGLALARWIAEAHGGTIACTSDPGVRTELTVVLPAADPAADPPLYRRRTGGGPSIVPPDPRQPLSADR